MYEALPENDRTFHVDMKGEDTGINYNGTFTSRCILDMGGKHSEELEKTRLMADYANPSNGLYGIAVTLSKLRARITEAPEWWKQSDGGSTIRDENVILHLFDEVVRLEQEWREELKDQGKEAKESNEKEDKESSEESTPKED